MSTTNKKRPVTGQKKKYQERIEKMTKEVAIGNPDSASNIRKNLQNTLFNASQRQEITEEEMTELLAYFDDIVAGNIVLPTLMDFAAIDWTKPL